MTGIFFYSILIFILLSIFVPSIYNYAYSCFIGRIVLVLLIIYFSKHNVLLGLIFLAIIITTSMPLYEGFLPQDILAKNMLVTSNYSIKDNTDNQEVFDNIKKYYCEKGSSSPNQDKLKRWSDILTSGDSDSKDIALANIMLQSLICLPEPTPMSQSLISQAPTTGSGLQFEKLDNTNCVYGRIPSPGTSGDGFTYLGNFNSYEECAKSSNIPSSAKAITYHDATAGGYAGQCFSINDNNTNVANQNYATCGIVTSTPTYYSLVAGSGMWSGEGPNEYTCKNEPTRNTTGNDGDYDRYCIFDKESDAKKYCNSDQRCVGYISNQAKNMFTITGKPVENPVANGMYYVKNVIPPPIRLPPPAPDNSQFYQNYNNNWNAAYARGNSNVNPNSISGCSYNNANYVFNTPECLSENIQEQVCNNDFIKNLIPSAQNISNNPSLDRYFQQDGQWMLNMYSQLCETSPVI